MTPARQPIPAEQRWWEKKPVAAAGSVGAGSGSAVAGSAVAGSAVAGSAADSPASRPRPQGAPSAVRPASPATPAAATAAAQAETARIAAGSLPAPPPLSAPLGLAGTGPMPQLSQTMAPPGATIWWAGSAPGSASAQARPGPFPYGSVLPGPGSHGSVPLGPVPHGSVPSAPGAPTPGPSAPGAPLPGPSASAPPTPATKPQPGPVAGAITLGLGILLLIIGAVGHASIIVIGGLVAAAWGIWRLVTGTGTRTGTGTGTGSNTKPPGQT